MYVLMTVMRLACWLFLFLTDADFKTMIALIPPQVMSSGLNVCSKLTRVLTSQRVKKLTKVFQLSPPQRFYEPSKEKTRRKRSEPQLLSNIFSLILTTKEILRKRKSQRRMLMNLEKVGVLTCMAHFTSGNYTRIYKRSHSRQ